MFDNNHDGKGIFITNRHLGWIVSIILLLSFFVFMAGYFLGQKRGVEKFSNKMEQDSLADQIYSSMCTLYDVNEDLSDASEDGGSEANNENSENRTTPEKNDSKVALTQEVVTDAIKDATITQAGASSYCAQLLGCGSMKTAEQFVNRWHKKGVELEIKTRQSKSAKGKVQRWYQVITARYSNKEDLDSLVQRIASQERLQDVRIVTC
ncbi:MAG: hypothetical protein M1114_05340 [Candidatus Dependentiae bacterium]|nr:hypothetical protein [Candidatus Dependentiae bacterium]